MAEGVRMNRPEHLIVVITCQRHHISSQDTARGGSTVSGKTHWRLKSNKEHILWIAGNYKQISSPNIHNDRHVEKVP